jgi:hypothetical protein
MDVIEVLNNFKKIKFTLVFFYVLLLLSCSSKDAIKNVNLQYQDSNAIAVSFELNDINDLKIYLKGETKTSILGEIKSMGHKHRFVPVIPFSAGQSYEIRKEGKNLTSFKVKEQMTLASPQILTIFPTKDTVPENLLKMYFIFSTPMQEVGNAIDFIHIYNETEQREVDLFLNLEKGLWNQDHTRLTLWLDPGRIKTGLIPNKLLGTPLKQGNSYILTVSNNWKSARGAPLPKNYTKRIVVGKKDKHKPDIMLWELSDPNANTKEALSIYFGESMDAVLAQESLQILYKSEIPVKGKFMLGKDEKSIIFIPLNSWNKGIYDISSHAIIEDLAGNNMNHLFDTNRAELKKPSQSETHYKRTFIVH